ncbi:MAG: hypothetical protein EOO28_34690 [Comamonadaceae bacterium]|nr:MAG: hypothetical protein EOO28_34690 [Comamonadaceae bacterium]
MIRRRATPDGLPFRVYERRGVRVYSIGYKLPSGVWAFRYECPIDDILQIAKLRRRAIEESVTVEADRPTGGFAGLVKAWIEWQEALPANDVRKRAASTLAENKREAENLKKAWGHLEPVDIEKSMAYDYLEACLTAKDKKGNPRPRPEKGNKEIALARLILEYGIRKKLLAVNPFDGITKNKTTKARRLVTQQEMDLAVEVGRKAEGARLIVALALRSAWLCVRRSVEVRGVTRDAVREDGMLWGDGKDPTKPKVLIAWSPELKETITEALAIKRNKVAGSMLIFGNMQGQKYTKGGWKSVLDDLMFDCVAEAADRKMAFQRFSLQDCRPMGVSGKLDRGDLDTKEATGHTSDKMISTVYDRRPIKHAKPAG